MAPKKSTALPKKATSKKVSHAAAPSHPPYAVLIKDAIAALKDRSGSSRLAIKKHIQESSPAAAASVAFDRSVRDALKRGVEKGIFVQTKQSFKNAPASGAHAAPAAAPKAKSAPVAKPKAKATAKPKAAAASTPKKRAPAKKAASAKKASPKQRAAPIKRAKSPAKTKKATAPRTKKAKVTEA